jgi:hypothetical protein
MLNKELIAMADKKSKTKPKRLSKGQRKHVRRLKQEDRKAVISSKLAEQYIASIGKVQEAE